MLRAAASASATAATKIDRDLDRRAADVPEAVVAELAEGERIGEDVGRAVEEDDQERPDRECDGERRADPADHRAARAVRLDCEEVGAGARRGRDDEADEEGEDEAQAADARLRHGAGSGGDEERHEDAERDQLAEREVHDARQPEDQRVADRDEPVDGARGETAREDLQGDGHSGPHSRLDRMTLRLATAGESHGPALVAILTGLPAGLELDRAAIDGDLKRRQEGYGRSPRQQIEQDRVEVLAGLRHGRTLGTPLALVVRNVDHKNWTWGMAPWPPEGEPAGKGTKPVTLPRPGHADLAGVLKYGHDDVRNALERASARHTAVHVAAGAVAKALLARLGIAVAGRPSTRHALRAAIDEARAERDTVGGIVEVRATGVPPGSARTRRRRTGSTRGSRSR